MTLRLFEHLLYAQLLVSNQEMTQSNPCSSNSRLLSFQRGTKTKNKTENSVN